MSNQLQLGAKAQDDDRHKLDVTVVLYHKGKIYTGGDDGVIKAWDTNLTKIAEVQAHSYSVCSLAGSEDHLYSCSDEGSIKRFDLNTLEEIDVLIENERIEEWKLFYNDGHLFSGDSYGKIIVWKDGTELGRADLAEPIKDFAISGKYLFTVKNTDLVVTEINLNPVRTDAEGRKQFRFATRAVHMGRFPLALIGKKYVATSEKDGKDIVIIENDETTKFKRFTRIENAHDMVVNALAGIDWNGQTLLFSSGWDSTLKKFRFNDDMVKQESSIELDFVGNSIAVGESGELYVGGEGGNVLRVEINAK